MQLLLAKFKVLYACSPGNTCAIRYKNNSDTETLPAAYGLTAALALTLQKAGADRNPQTMA
jgi:hypothetical protein